MAQVLTKRAKRKKESLKLAASFIADRGLRQYISKGDIEALAELLRGVRDGALDSAIEIVEKLMDPDDTLSSLEDAKAGK